MRLVIIQHCPVTPAGLVGEVAAAAGARIFTLKPHHGDSLPPDARRINGLVVLGGPMHAGDDEGYPAFQPLMELIRDCHERKVPVLGLCLGAQLIARAFGAKVAPMGTLEVGYPLVEINDAGARDPLLRGLARAQRIMQMHEDRCELPAGAIRLMTNEACLNQAFRLGRTTYGFQAHPEVTLKDARNFPRDCWAAMTRHFGDGAIEVEKRVLPEIEAHYESGAAFCRVVAGRFMALVAERSGLAKTMHASKAALQARRR